MALINCPECDNEVSSQAQLCPKCGYVLKKPKKEKKSGSGCGSGCLALIAIIVILGFIGALVDSDSDSSRSSESRTPEERRRERIERHFSAWNGSHYGLTKVIKQSMNDPDSYDHVETTYGDKGDHLIVKTTFRGKNAFGGVVTNWVIAKVDLNGKVLKVLSQGP